MSEQEEIKLNERLNEGLAWSYEKMLRDKASRNESVLVSKNGVPVAEPAEEVLKKYSERVVYFEGDAK